nr:hypothetical protein BaRGS_030573 [Batillaria attramentaria]
MVWQEQTTHIVMLTNLIEGDKNKCVQYWPSKGTFVALDIAMDGAQKESEIDIFAIVQRMREDRCSMVQTKVIKEKGVSQYRFVHEAILEAYTSRHTRLAQLAFNSFVPHDIDPVKEHDRVDSEYRLLNQMKVLLHKPSHTVAEDEENIGKNRTLDILPGRV